MVGWQAGLASACAECVAACAASSNSSSSTCCNVLDAHMGSAIPMTTGREDSDTRTYKAFSHGRFALNFEHVSAVRMTIYGSLLMW